MTMRAAALAVCLLLSSQGIAVEIRPSQVAPARLAMASDPQTIYVRPGNVGLELFSDDDTTNVANLDPAHDEYSNAVMVELASPLYDMTITEDAQTTPSYWPRLTELMSSLQWSGQSAFWIADDDLIAIYQAAPEVAEAITSNITQMMNWRMTAPAIVVDAAHWSPAAQSFVAHIRASGLPISIGTHLRPERLSLARRHDWDFVICDEEVIPLHYRGQAAAAWVRSIAGEVPVILSPRDHDFFRDIVWVSCGAAGILYRPLPLVGTAENKSAALQLRASTTFLNRFRGGTLPLKAHPDHAGFIFCLEEPGVAWSGVLSAGLPAMELPAPGGMVGRHVRESWFNPATDQTIIRPLTRLPATVSVQAPDENLWIYSIIAAHEQAANFTTTTQIIDLPY